MNNVSLSPHRMRSELAPARNLRKAAEESAG